MKRAQEAFAQFPDRALELLQQHPQLDIRHAFPWATAQINNSVYVSIDFPRLTAQDPTVWIPYRRRPAENTDAPGA